MGIGCLICDDLIESGAPEGSVNKKPKATATARTSKKPTLPPATVNDSIVTPCGHIFHELCLEQWFKSKKTGTCPVCRKTCTKARLIRIFPSLVEDDKVEFGGPSTSNAQAKKENSKEAPETKPIVPPKPQISQASQVTFANNPFHTMELHPREASAAPSTVRGNPPTTTNLDGTALDRNKRSLTTYLNALRTNTVGGPINNAVSSTAAYFDGIRRRVATVNSRLALGIHNSRASSFSAAAESLNLANDNFRANCPSTSSAVSAQDESINTLETMQKKLGALSNGFKVPEKTNAASTWVGGQSTSQAIAGTSQSGNNQAMQNPPVPNVKTGAPAVIHIQDRVPEEPAHAHKCHRYEELKVIHNTLITDYSELQLKCNNLENKNQLLKVQLESCEDEMKKLRRGTSGISSKDCSQLRSPPTRNSSSRTKAGLIVSTIQPKSALGSGCSNLHHLENPSMEAS